MGSPRLTDYIIVLFNNEMAADANGNPLKHGASRMTRKRLSEYYLKLVWKYVSLSHIIINLNFEQIFIIVFQKLLNMLNKYNCQIIPIMLVEMLE